MKKLVLVAVVVLVGGIGLVVAPTGTEAKDFNCYNKCIGSTPYYCCVNASGEVCKPDPAFRCLED